VFRQARTPFAPGNGDWVGVSEFLHPVFRFHFPETLENETRSLSLSLTLSDTLWLCLCLSLLVS
jgi:hypothetical protein